MQQSVMPRQQLHSPLPDFRFYFDPEMIDFIHLVDVVVGVPDREQQGEGLLGRDVREAEAGDELGQSSRCTEK